MKIKYFFPFKRCRSFRNHTKWVLDSFYLWVWLPVFCQCSQEGKNKKKKYEKKTKKKKPKIFSWKIVKNCKKITECQKKYHKSFNIYTFSGLLQRLELRTGKFSDKLFNTFVMNFWWGTFKLCVQSMCIDDRKPHQRWDITLVPVHALSPGERTNLCQICLMH